MIKMSRTTIQIETHEITIIRYGKIVSGKPVDTEWETAEVHAYHDALPPSTMTDQEETKGEKRDE